MRAAIHFILHLVAPGLAARTALKDNWKRGWAIMLGGMLADLDHLLATPIYDADRCSIGFHPLHSQVAIVVYILMTALPKSRIVGAGLLIHMALDSLDCLWMHLGATPGT
ncbi:MAG: hypothetical protein HQ592_14645 [Planctomycetes bacterium]|nr:hypothetical protein [Planctomycetota bacterium]